MIPGKRTHSKGLAMNQNAPLAGFPQHPCLVDDASAERFARNQKNFRTTVARTESRPKVGGRLRPLLRPTVGRPEGAGTNQPGAERSAAPGWL